MNKKTVPHKHNDKTEKLILCLPDNRIPVRMAETFKLISDPTRLKVLYLLCHTEECVSNIAAAADMSAPAVSHHLRVLKQAGILTVRRAGKEVYYRLADGPYAETVHNIIDISFNCKCTSCTNSTIKCDNCDC